MTLRKAVATLVDAGVEKELIAGLTPRSVKKLAGRYIASESKAATKAVEAKLGITSPVGKLTGYISRKYDEVLQAEDTEGVSVKDLLD
jgi:hypothetical protein